jgi:hypothetical protein
MKEFYILLTLVFYVNVWQSYVKRRHVIKEGGFSPRHTDNSDQVSDAESWASEKFHYTNVKTNTKKVSLYKWKLLIKGLYVDRWLKLFYSIVPHLWWMNYKNK